VHDGGDVMRNERVKALAGWAEAWPLLRVCDHPRRPTIDADRRVVDNCCRCTKCLRTMIPLEIYGALGNFAAFPLPLTPGSALAMRYEWPQWVVDNLKLALRARRFDLALPLLLALGGSYLRVIYRRLPKRWQRFTRQA
jgi:hypothetical protein